MTVEYSRKWCPECGRNVSIHRPKLGGCVIILGTMLSCGLLLPFIILYQMGFSGWRCVRCGRSL